MHIPTFLQVVPLILALSKATIADIDAGMPGFAQDALSAFHHFTPDHITKPIPVAIPTNTHTEETETPAEEPFDDTATITSAPSLAPRKPPDTPSRTTIQGHKAKAIFICNQAGWRGNCWVRPMSRGVCVNWDEVRSAGPEDTLSCDFYEGEGCKGEPALKGIKGPGVGDTGRGGLRSWKCH